MLALLREDLHAHHRCTPNPGHENGNHRCDCPHPDCLDVMNLGPWIALSKGFGGCDAMAGYLPSTKLTIAVVVTYGPGAYDDQGSYKNSDASRKIFASLADALAPGTLPKEMLRN